MTATLAQKSVPLPYQDSPEKGSPAGGQLNSINDLILHKAKTVPNTPLIAYPISKDGQSRLLEYTSRDIDLFVDATAKELDRLGLKPQVFILPLLACQSLTVCRIRGAIKARSLR